VRGVVVNGRFLGAGTVVSNANVKTTIERLVGVENVSEPYLAAARAVRLANSSCQVFLGLARGATIPFIGDLVFHSERATFDSDALCDFHGQSRTFSVYYPKCRPGSDRHAIVSSTNARWRDWADLDQAGYEREKQPAGDTLDCLGPTSRVCGRIEHREVATPRTRCSAAPAGRLPHPFEGWPRRPLEQVEGLFHAGSVASCPAGWARRTTAIRPTRSTRTCSRALPRAMTRAPRSTAPRSSTASPPRALPVPRPHRRVQRAAPSAQYPARRRGRALDAGPEEPGRVARLRAPTSSAGTIPATP
jgi:hypothetical protein